MTYVIRRVCHFLYSKFIIPLQPFLLFHQISLLFQFLLNPVQVAFRGRSRSMIMASAGQSLYGLVGAAGHLFRKFRRIQAVVYNQIRPDLSIEPVLHRYVQHTAAAVNNRLQLIQRILRCVIHRKHPDTGAFPTGIFLKDVAR